MWKSSLVVLVAVLSVACQNGSQQNARSGATPPSVAPISPSGQQSVPRKLFGIDLGGVYELGSSDDDIGNLPIKKFAGMNKFLGEGIHYYFSPQIENAAFPYVEHRDRPDDKYFKTSFRMYLLPVIPPSIATLEQLNKAKLKWEVTTIEWSDEEKDESKRYAWAFDLCQTFSADITVEPEITNQYKDEYTCTFSSEDREFKVSSRYSKSVALAFKGKYFSEKNDAVDTVVRRLRAKDIRPY
jgi:hypothetical protein